MSFETVHIGLRTISVRGGSTTAGLGKMDLRFPEHRAVEEMGPRELQASNRVDAHPPPVLPGQPIHLGAPRYGIALSGDFGIRNGATNGLVLPFPPRDSSQEIWLAISRAQQGASSLLSRYCSPLRRVRPRESHSDFRHYVRHSVLRNAKPRHDVAEGLVSPITCGVREYSALCRSIQGPEPSFFFPCFGLGSSFGPALSLGPVSTAQGRGNQNGCAFLVRSAAHPLHLTRLDTKCISIVGEGGQWT